MMKNNMYEAPKAEIVELNVNRNFMENPTEISGGDF